MESGNYVASSGLRAKSATVRLKQLDRIREQWELYGEHDDRTMLSPAISVSQSRTGAQRESWDFPKKYRLASRHVTRVPHEWPRSQTPHI